MKLTEKKLSSKLLYDGKILNLRLDEVELPDGNTAHREYVVHSGGAAALFVKDGTVALVKQFRYVYDKEIYEIPAGKLNVGEDPKKAAVRELEEETGYRALSAKELLKIYPTPGYTNEIVYVYQVNDAEFVGEKLDDGEFLKFEFVPLDKVMKMIDKGEICDAKTVAALYKYFYEINAHK